MNPITALQSTKRVTALVIFLGLQGQLPAQVIPNASFETWNFNGSWEDPADWGTPNGTTFIMGFTTVTKASVAVTGSYSVKLTTRSQANLIIPGVIATGSVDVFAKIFKGGFPLADSVKFLSGYYRFLNDTLIAGYDSALFVSYLWKWNSALNRRDTIAYLNFRAPTASTFQPFWAPYSYVSKALPDSAFILMASTKDLVTPKPSGSLWVDQLVFSNTVGVQEPAEEALRLYPNPAGEVIRISGMNPSQQAVLELFDLKGSLVFRAHTDKARVTLHQVPPGFYICKLLVDGGGLVYWSKLLISR